MFLPFVFAKPAFAVAAQETFSYALLSDSRLIRLRDFDFVEPMHFVVNGPVYELGNYVGVP